MANLAHTSHVLNIVPRTTPRALFLSDPTQMKYVKFEIQDLALFLHLKMNSVKFDGLSEIKSANKNKRRKSKKYIFLDIS